MADPIPLRSAGRSINVGGGTYNSPYLDAADCEAELSAGPGAGGKPVRYPERPASADLFGALFPAVVTAAGVAYALASLNAETLFSAVAAVAAGGLVATLGLGVNAWGLAKRLRTTRGERDTAERGFRRLQESQSRGRALHARHMGEARVDVANLKSRVDELGRELEFHKRQRATVEAELDARKRAAFPLTGCERSELEELRRNVAALQATLERLEADEEPAARFVLAAVNGWLQRKAAEDVAAASAGEVVA